MAAYDLSLLGEVLHLMPSPTLSVSSAGVQETC